MADFNIGNLMKKCINTVIDKGVSENPFEDLWFSLTRRMFQKYSALDVYNQVEQALEEASDKQWFEHKYPNWVFSDKPPKAQFGDGIIMKGKMRQTIDANLKITEVAKYYGLKVKGKKAICPFHEDKDPSLSFSDDKNVFNCFGCGAKGDVVEFIRRMEEKNGNKKRG